MLSEHGEAPSAIKPPHVRAWDLPIRRASGKFMGQIVIPSLAPESGARWEVGGEGAAAGSHAGSLVAEQPGWRNDAEMGPDPHPPAACQEQWG